VDFFACNEADEATAGARVAPPELAVPDGVGMSAGLGAAFVDDRDVKEKGVVVEAAAPKPGKPAKRGVGVGWVAMFRAKSKGT
jgi:hypothetical protein